MNAGKFEESKRQEFLTLVRQIRLARTLYPVAYLLLVIPALINFEILPLSKDFIAVFLIVGLATMVKMTFTQSMASNRLKSLILGLNSPTDVGALAELANLDPEIRSRAERVIAQVLPDLESDEALNLSPYHRHCLYRLLFEPPTVFLRPYRYYGVFPPILLRFIHKFGGSEAIPYLEDFATWAHAQKDSEIRELGDYARAAVGDVRLRAAKAIIDQRVLDVRDQEESASRRIERLSAPSNSTGNVNAETIDHNPVNSD